MRYLQNGFAMRFPLFSATIGRMACLLLTLMPSLGFSLPLESRVPGGIDYREAQLIMEMVADTGRMGSLDLVEVNPALDKRNATARLAVDLVESLFGKSTLMRD